MDIGGNITCLVDLLQTILLSTITDAIYVLFYGAKEEFENN